MYQNKFAQFNMNFLLKYAHFLWNVHMPLNIWTLIAI